jgi:hypothetical protein
MPSIGELPTKLGRADISVWSSRAVAGFRRCGRVPVRARFPADRTGALWDQGRPAMDHFVRKLAVSSDL